MNILNEDTLSPQEKEIADAYYGEVTGYDTAKRHMPPFFIATIGLVGAGKTTVLKRLNQRLHVVRISSDELRERLYLVGIDMERSRYLALFVLKCAMRAGYSVILDADAVQKNVRDEISECESNGVTVIWLRMDTPIQFIEQKLRNYRHTYLFKDADDAVATLHQRMLFHQKYSDELDVLPYVYRFDTSRNDLVRQVDEAAYSIRELLKEKGSAK